ncbi:MAG TPA: Ig-like domain-containing protein [Puia sp.]|jgi:hypothetical protein
MKRALWMFLLIGGFQAAQAQTASFNFSEAAQSVSGWTNVFGNPATGVRTATASSGITITSVSTSNWVPYTSGDAASDGGGETTGSSFFFPAAVILNHWFQYSDFLANYNALMPQLQIGGLSIDSVYTIKMTGSYSAAIPPFNLNPVRYTVAGATVYGYVDVDCEFNTANGAIFTNIAPDGSGNIKIYVNTYGGSNVASICGLQVIAGHTATVNPTVTITHPANNTIIPEDGVTTITATATETGGSIARVEFYADTVKIGVDSTAPYTLNWSSPDPGTYTLKARAIDGVGNATTATVTVQVESLNYFWSTTGNIATGGDSSFVGTVDSNRLAFRTKNIERLSILPTGNIGIGTLTPSAQFHTTGSVRLAGLTNDSTRNRVLVSDTSGNLFYRNVSSLSNRWLYAAGTVYDSVDNIGIGTSNTQGYKLAVNGTAIFTKVRVKTAGTWPDYVFKKGFVLPDLTELERYVATYKHLPGIVTEGEVLKDGIDVGAHAAAVLQKVEELTLYLIEENKKLKEQNARLEQQQQEIDELKKLIRKEK